MFGHLLLTLALSVPQQAPRDAAAGKTATPIVGTASISGIVVTDDADRRPVRRARVSIMDVERRQGATVVTDDSGRFTFRNVPAGRYSVTPTKAAWVGTTYGATRPNRPGTPITVADGQQIDKLTVKLARGAVITGTITDEYGRPMVRASVSAFRYVFQSGTRTPIPAGPGSQSDDRGVYRIYGLAPGQYLVGTSPRGMVSPMATELRQTTDAEIQRALGGRGGRGTPDARQDERSTTVAYSSVFYPGTTTVSQGSLITVAAGEERSGIDFQASLVPTSRVEGTVVLPDGGVAPAASVNVVSSDGSTPGFGFETFRLGRTSGDGRFLFSGLPSGKYTIISRAASPREPQAPATPPAGRGGQPITLSLWAIAEIVLDGQNVSGLTMTLQPGFTISGRLDFKGTLAPPDVTRLRIQLMPAVPAPGQVLVGVSPAVVNADGSFTFAGVTPGQYRVTAAIPNARPDQPGWVLMSAVFSGRDALDTPLELRQSVSDALLTFTDRPAELSGLLQDPSGRPAPDYYIVVFASDRTHWSPQSRRIRAMRPSAEGRFIVRNLPAGEYLIAAVTDIEDGEWMDPSVLQQLSTVSMKLTIADGEKKSQDIQVGASR